MLDKKLAAQQAKDLLSVCLAKAIDYAMNRIQGPYWFMNFAAQDQQQEPKKQILKNGQRNIMDLDLQALLKILRYREAYAEPILTYYRFITPEDAFAAQGQLRQFRSLLDRLITDFRNQMEAHTRVADIENARGDGQLYGYEEALQDMEKLAGIFKVVTDPEGVSYYQRIQTLRQSKGKKKRNLLPLWIGIIALSLAAVGVGLWLWLKPETEAKDPSSKKETVNTEGNVFYRPENHAVKDGELILRPKHVYYDGDEIVATCFIINGKDETIYGIDFEKVIFSNKEGRICGASFGLLEDINLSAGSYLEKTFRFPAETVDVQDADLGYLHISLDCRYQS